MGRQVRLHLGWIVEEVCEALMLELCCLWSMLRGGAQLCRWGYALTASALEISVLGHLLLQIPGHNTQSGFLLLCWTSQQNYTFPISSSPGQGYVNCFWHAEWGTLQQTQQPQLD